MGEINLANRQFGSRKPTLIKGTNIKIHAMTKEEAEKVTDNLLRFCEAHKIEIPELNTKDDFDYSEFILEK